MNNYIGSVHFTHFTTIYANAAFSCCFNSLLLYLIRTTVTHIGSYSRLLSLMAIFNMSYAVIHVFDAPFMLVEGRVGALIPTGIFEDKISIGYPLTLAYCSFFAQSIVLLLYHFLYRYIAVCKPHLMELMHRPRTICFSLFVYISVAAFWACLVKSLTDEEAKLSISALMKRKLGINANTSGAVAVSFKIITSTGEQPNLHAWIGSMIACTIMVTSFSVMTFWAVSIYRKLRECQALSSNISGQLQMQLFRALIVQTIVPLVLEYTAGFLMYFIPMCGLPIDVGFTPLCVSTYPVVEPLVVIYFVRDYRTSLLKKLRLWKPDLVPAGSSIRPLETSTWQSFKNQNNHELA